MFYLENSKVYLTEKDPKTNTYPEVELVVAATEPEIQFNIKLKGSGVANKPAKRTVISMPEFIAKFGEKALEQYNKPKAATKKTSDK